MEVDNTQEQRIESVVMDFSFVEWIGKNHYVWVNYGTGFWCDESEYEWMGEQNRLITTQQLYEIYKK